MAERTVGQPATVNIRHGHFDGLRGHEDEHEHSGGDTAHPHRNDSTLGRSAKVGEYVHPNNLPRARAELAAARRRLAGLADTPTEEIRAVGAFEPGIEPTVVSATPTTDLALTTAGNGHRPQKYADLVRIAEKVDALRADVQRTIDLETELDAAADLLAAARAQEADSEVVDPSILHQLEEHHDRYAIRLQDWIGQRGLRKIEGAGS